MSLRRSRLTNAVSLPGIAVPTVDFSALSIQDCRPLDKKPNFCPSEAEVKVASAHDESLKLSPIWAGHEEDPFLAFQDVPAVGVSLEELQKMIEDLQNNIDNLSQEEGAEILFHLSKEQTSAESGQVETTIQRKKRELQALKDEMQRLAQKRPSDTNLSQGKTKTSKSTEPGRQMYFLPDDKNDDFFMITKRWVDNESIYVDTFIPAIILQVLDGIHKNKYHAFTLEGWYPRLPSKPGEESKSFTEVFFGKTDPKTPPPRYLASFEYLKSELTPYFEKKTDLITELRMITLDEATEAMKRSSFLFDDLVERHKNLVESHKELLKQHGISTIPKDKGIISAFIASKLPYESQSFNVQVPILFKVEWPSRKVSGYELAYKDTDGKGYLNWKKMTHMPGKEPLQGERGCKLDYTRYPHEYSIDTIRSDSNPFAKRALQKKKKYEPIGLAHKSHNYDHYYKYLIESMNDEIQELEKLSASGGSSSLPSASPSVLTPSPIEEMDTGCESDDSDATVENDKAFIQGL